MLMAFASFVALPAFAGFLLPTLPVSRNVLIKLEYTEKESDNYGQEILNVGCNIFLYSQNQ